MRYQPLGKTRLEVSTIAFGAGPIADLMTAPERIAEQVATVRRAVELGVNWFDTAATYGEGRSEAALGRAIAALGLADRIHVATKVRIPPNQIHDIRGHILRSVEASLQRLQLPAVSLLQLHNSLTAERGAQPTSLTPRDALGEVLETFQELRRARLVRHIGLTGLGEPAALAETLGSCQYETVQTPYHLLNPSSGRQMPADFAEQNLGNLFSICQQRQIGVFAIRVFAGGALAGKPPSQHTLTTPFFPLDLYCRDQERAARLQPRLSPGMTLSELAVRFALSHNAVSAAIVGLGSPAEVEQTIAFADRGPLSSEELAMIDE